MASGGNKTEKATPKRREEARKKGQIAKSQDLSGSLVLIGGLIALSVWGPHIVETLGESMRTTIGMMASPRQVTAGMLGQVAVESGKTIALTVGPIALTCMFSGVLGNVIQVRPHLNTAGLKPNPKKLNPIAGAKNLFGPNAIFETGKNLGKVSIVGAIVTFALLPKLDELSGLVGMSPTDFVSKLATTVLGIAQRAAIAYLLIGVIDFAYQRWRHEKSLKMDKQEIKDEHKNANTPAEVRGAIRRRQYQAAKARMMADVPDADVVVTNPTHYAVALKYDGEKLAPAVVAKGKDIVAAQIRKIARENDVPVVADPPLARTLHKTVEVGHEIPEDLYQAVAQLLAFVYRIARKQAV
ncbi:MAG: flagellar biosynthesis protein FlhB [Thermoleophilaceae bacterium]|jgi:flagellar biosynthetic protein FlhB|nr:flagellar biosynthesis protein FlhB [Thermoleophilaceae bacterium]